MKRTQAGVYSAGFTFEDASDEREVDIAVGELRTADLRLHEAPPFRTPAPVAPNLAPAETDKPEQVEPTTSAAPSAPNPSARSPRTWPAVLVWTSAGVATIGAIFAGGGLIATENSVAERRRHDATIATKGCGAGTPLCDNYLDNERSLDTSSVVSGLGLAVSTLAAACLLSVGLIGDVTDPAGTVPQAPANDSPVNIEAAPTVGGMVLRGTF